MLIKPHKKCGKTPELREFLEGYELVCPCGVVIGTSPGKPEDAIKSWNKANTE